MSGKVLTQLKALRAQVRTYKDTITYYEKLFKADGEIDNKEQAQLDKLNAAIQKIDNNIVERKSKLKFKSKVTNASNGIKEGVGDFFSRKDDIVDPSLVDYHGTSKEDTDNEIAEGGYIKPSWIREAEKHLGKKETARMVKDDPWIKLLFEELGAYDWAKDQTVQDANWCAAFVSYCFKKTGQSPLTGFDGMRARTYADKYGKEVTRPVYGALAIVQRGGAGHIGFVVGYNKRNGKITLLGGNQGNKVSIKKEGRTLIAYKVPSGWNIPEKNYLD